MFALPSISPHQHSAKSSTFQPTATHPLPVACPCAVLVPDPADRLRYTRVEISSDLGVCPTYRQSVLHVHLDVWCSACVLGYEQSLVDMYDEKMF